MKLLVSSGEFREIIEAKTDDRRVAHRLGCIKALESLESGKKLGRIIGTSIHLDHREPADDDLFTATEVAAELLGYDVDVYEVNSE